MLDLPRLSRVELTRLDRLASGELGLPSAVLMENAGRGAAGEVLSLLRGSSALSDTSTPASDAPRVAVFAGSGNNGGDACVVARHLRTAGIEVEVFAGCGLQELSGDAQIMRRAIEQMGIPVHDVSTENGLAAARPALERATVVVDGLLGTGFRGELRPKAGRLIEAIEACRTQRRAAVVALDLPSGLDADTGRAARPTVVAGLTVTFAAWKLGFDAPEAGPYLGRVVVATIGVPVTLLQRVRGSEPGG